MSLLRPYINKQEALLLPYLDGTKQLLDFGCGDLSLAKGLKKALPKLKITGVDVVDAGVRSKEIEFKLYNGHTLPFPQKTFDTTIIYHVFHHCDDPRAALAEVMRVTKKQLLIVEPVYRSSLDLFFMKILDRVGNGWRNVTIPMPFTFQKESTWTDWAREFKWKVTATRHAGVLPCWLPFGETKLFVIRFS